MGLTKAQLEEQLAASKNDVENSRIMLHRSEGMVLLLTHLLELASEAPPDDTL